MNSVEIVIVVSMFGFPCLFTELFIVFFVITSAVMNKIEYVIPIWSANHLQTPIMRSAPPHTHARQCDYYGISHVLFMAVA